MGMFAQLPHVYVVNATKTLDEYRLESRKEKNFLVREGTNTSTVLRVLVLGKHGKESNYGPVYVCVSVDVFQAMTVSDKILSA